MYYSSLNDFLHKILKSFIFFFFLYFYHYKDIQLLPGFSLQELRQLITEKKEKKRRRTFGQHFAFIVTIFACFFLQAFKLKKNKKKTEKLHCLNWNRPACNKTADSTFYTNPLIRLNVKWMMEPNKSNKTVLCEEL